MSVKMLHKNHNIGSISGHWTLRIIVRTYFSLVLFVKCVKFRDVLYFRTCIGNYYTHMF